MTKFPETRSNFCSCVQDISTAVNGKSKYCLSNASQKHTYTHTHTLTLRSPGVDAICVNRSVTCLISRLRVNAFATLRKHLYLSALCYQKVTQTQPHEHREWNQLRGLGYCGWLRLVSGHEQGMPRCSSWRSTGYVGDILMTMENALQTSRQAWSCHEV